MWKFKHLPFYIDLAFCLILLPAMITLFPIERWMTNNSTFVYLLVSWLYVVYILNRSLSIPFLFAGNRRFWIAVTLILLTVAGTYLITRYQMEVPSHRMQPKRFIEHIPKIRLQQQAVWFLFVVVSTFSMAVGLLTELYHQIMQRQAVEFEKKKAELALYKAQINPHFLFNSLNTLYGMLVTHSPQAEDAFTQFISLMRYMYANNTQDKIPVLTEVEYIRQYIELQKYRLPQEFHVHFSYEHDETEQQGITPMVLITFVENVFKHGISSHKPGNAYIHIQAVRGTLQLSTQNPLLNHQAANPSKGIGLENCKKRLELLYPHKHNLQIEEKDGLFTVTLYIDLNA